MTRRIALVALSMAECLLVVAAPKLARAGDVDYLANVWVGGSPAINEFLRLDMRPDGTGSLMIQYRGSQPARAYRITATQLELESHRVEFTVEPAEELAKPIYVKGAALPERLSLEFGSPKAEWRQRVELGPLAILTAHIEAVSKRAADLKPAGK
jgi:hypothetical protein